MFFRSAQATVSTKSREQVKRELAQAIHDGEMVANGEDGRRLKDIFPGSYDTQHVHASNAPENAGSGS